jgi:type II secretory pathway pseudopilin PulG
MLDVHPPHETVHTWRDFLIHIATIVVGLLIAVALEQSVEAIHRHFEVKETRNELREEREENRRFFAVNVQDFRLQNALLHNNLRVLRYLQQHPGTPREQLPGDVRWGLSYEPAIDSAWKNAQQTQVLSLFPRQEAEDDATLYSLLQVADTQAEQILYPAIVSARAYTFVDPDPAHLSPAELAQEIDLTKNVIGLNQTWGIYLTDLNRYQPDFAPALTKADLELNTMTDADRRKLAPAISITDAEIAPILALRAAAKKAAGDTH